MHVLIGDGHPVTRFGLCRVIASVSDDVRCEEAGTFSECLDIVRANKDLGLIVIDMAMKDMPWEEGLRQLRELAGDAPIVATSYNEARADIFRAVELGASGYVPKTTSEEQLKKAVNLVLSGAVYLPRATISGAGEESVSGGRARTGAGSISEDAMPMLTKRQREVLKLLAEGKRNGEIAEILGTSEFTVRVHVSAILKGLGVANRTQAALKAQDVLRDD